MPDPERQHRGPGRARELDRDGAGGVHRPGAPRGQPDGEADASPEQLVFLDKQAASGKAQIQHLFQWLAESAGEDRKRAIGDCIRALSRAASAPQGPVFTIFEALNTFSAPGQPYHWRFGPLTEAEKARGMRFDDDDEADAEKT